MKLLINDTIEATCEQMCIGKKVYISEGSFVEKEQVPLFTVSIHGITMSKKVFPLKCTKLEVGGYCIQKAVLEKLIVFEDALKWSVDLVTTWDNIKEI